MSYNLAHEGPMTLAKDFDRFGRAVGQQQPVRAVV